MVSEEDCVNTMFNQPVVGAPAVSSEQKAPGSRMNSVLVVDDEPGIRSFLKRGLEKSFALVEVAGDIQTAEALRQRCHFDLLIADIRLPGRSGVEWIADLREQGGTNAVIFMTAHADVETAISALRAGAADFIMKPFRMEHMQAAIERCMERQQMLRENYVLKRQLDQIYDRDGIVGNSSLIRNAFQVIKRVAPMPSTILIEGESGTGKELAARAIHAWSGRTGSFVPLNCGAMAAELLESELFGHAKGAFTGAHQSREGLFAYADGGTLFLDEIGEMPLNMQAHLLRVLEERTIRPVGSNQEMPVDVRIIAASNRNLEQQVRLGRFREDLFYRLNILSIRMPALRERKEDIALLVKHFSVSLAAELGTAVPTCDESELEHLRAYAWPGNVRELKNVIERCLLLGTTPSQCLAGMGRSGADERSEQEEPLQLDVVEKRHILRVLENEGGNKSAAARRLGISRKTLERKVQAWGRD